MSFFSLGLDAGEKVFITYVDNYEFMSTDAQNVTFQR